LLLLSPHSHHLRLNFFQRLWLCSLLLTLRLLLASTRAKPRRIHQEIIQTGSELVCRPLLLLLLLRRLCGLTKIKIPPNLSTKVTKSILIQIVPALIQFIS